MGGSVFLTAFLGLFLAIGLAILGLGARSMQLSKEAERWPTAQGRITSSDFIVDTGDDSTTYRVKLAYSYNAMGRDLAGEKIAFGYSGSSSEKFHRDIYEALPVDTVVGVRYSPADPERAVLSFGLNQSIVFLMIFGAVWTFFTLGMMAMFWLSGQGAGGLLENIVVYSRG